jgi:hypothetical protein
MVSMDYQYWLSCLCIWREARGASVAAKNAVWYVLQNRSTDAQRRWPRTLAGVILQREQFSSFNAGDPNAALFPIAPIPPADASRDWLAFLDCQTVVNSPIGDDPTMGANCYESLPDGAPRPSWASAEALTVQIGPFRFYKT